jgi:hypothetical protein
LEVSFIPYSHKNLIFIIFNLQYGGKMGVIFEWDEEKRQKNIKGRDLDILKIASIMFSSPDIIIWPDNRVNYVKSVGVENFQPLRF